MNIEITKEIIFNYLSGRASALQKRMIDDWVKKPENEELFYKWLVEYECQNPQYSTDIAAGLDRFNQLANQVDENPDGSILSETEEKEFTNFSWRWWAIAASIISVLVTGWVYQDTFLYKTHRTEFGETQTITLSDGTQVTLNANSSLEVPRFGFGKKTRQVRLTGEANFSVTHTVDNQRFVVKTEKGVEVVVLGTEFSVYARRKEAKVVLNKGKVQLRYQVGKTQKGLVRKPGELVTFDHSNRRKKGITEQPEKHTAWKEHRFVFDDTTLEEFVRIMADNYGLKVIIADDSLAQRTLVGSFRANNADELLEIVSEIFNLQITKVGDTVLLTDK